MSYVTKAWTDNADCGSGSRPTETVYEAIHAPVDTGLFDQHGTRIYRMPETVRLGFDLTPPRPRIRVKAGSTKA